MATWTGIEMCPYCSSHSDTDLIWNIQFFMFFFHPEQLTEACIERKITHTNSLDKKWRVIWNHCKESGDKNICLEHTRTAILEKSWFFFLFLFLFLQVGEWNHPFPSSLFSPFCVSEPNSAAAQNGAPRKQLCHCDFWSFFNVPECFLCLLCSCSCVKKVGSWGRGCKHSPLWSLKEGLAT